MFSSFCQTPSVKKADITGVQLFLSDSLRYVKKADITGVKLFLSDSLRYVKVKKADITGVKLFLSDSLRYVKKADITGVQLFLSDSLRYVKKADIRSSSCQTPSDMLRKLILPVLALLVRLPQIC